LGLEIPVPALRTCTPSLLLLVFERLAARRLTLGEGVRRPASTDAEVELARAVLSALGAAIGADLSVVDCRALAKGAEGELAAAVMALAVLARRIGVVLDLDEGSVTSRKSRASDSSRSASALRSRSLLDEHDEHVPVRPLDPDMFITPPRCEC
jgi:hypothetical protein